MHGDLELIILKAEVREIEGGTECPGEVLGKDIEKGILIQTGSGILAVNTLQ
jgi:methionyl-tRNA formyltransferase